MKEKLTIGVVAKLGDVSVETIRYYQRRGLLQEPSKPRGGFRQYSQELVRRVRFIKRAQQLGFTLEETQGLLDLDERSGCRETRRAAADKLALIEQKIEDLAQMRSALVKLVGACDASLAGAPCPIIRLLSDN